MRVLRDFFDRITRVIDNDFLRSNENAHGGFESLDIKITVRSLELHQIERSKIARRVIEEEIFRAGISRILSISAFAGVPLWIVESNCIPGSPQMCVPSAILRNSVRASLRSHGCP